MKKEFIKYIITALILCAFPLSLKGAPSEGMQQEAAMQICDRYNNQLKVAVPNVTDEGFAKAVAEGISVVDFGFRGCVWCGKIAPFFNHLAAKYGADGVKFFKYDVMGQQIAARTYGVGNVPSVLVFKDGKLVSVQTGYTKLCTGLEDEILKALGR
jgi:thioredoxin 1